MNTEPKALQLARWLEHRSMGGVTPKDLAASKELKRLYVENEFLRTLNAAVQDEGDVAFRIPRSSCF